MSVSTPHPQYTPQRKAEWAIMRAAIAGESAIKSAGEIYLPKPGGFSTMSDGGVAAYSAYMKRATFPEILSPSVSALIGIAHGKEIQIEVPDALGYLIEDADGEGQPIEAFHRKITRELLVMGRYGILADAPAGGGDPYLAGYTAETIINWAKGLFTLDESGMVWDGQAWVEQEQYRDLLLEDGRYVQRVTTGGSSIDVEPNLSGGGAVDFIPFAVASAIDVKPDIRTPPMIGVARAAVDIYQLDADQRHQLFMSGQETLVIVNGEAPDAVGAGVVITLTAGEGVTADAKYVSPSCTGIEAHAEKIKDKRTEAVMAGARLLEQSDNVQESGNARRLRFASETATLTSVVHNSCALLERSLRNVALLKGITSVDDIVVRPPETLLDTTMEPAEFAALFGVYERDGMSWETYYENGQRGGVFSPERTAAEEYALLDGQSGGEF